MRQQPRLSCGNPGTWLSPRSPSAPAVQHSQIQVPGICTNVPRPQEISPRGFLPRGCCLATNKLIIKLDDSNQDPGRHPALEDQRADMRNSLAHRPLLTQAQAAFLAREVYGISVCIPDSNDQPPLTGSVDATASAACVELPSYDDRNFLVRGSWAGLPGRQQAPPPSLGKLGQPGFHAGSHDAVTPTVRAQTQVNVGGEEGAGGGGGQGAAARGRVHAGGVAATVVSDCLDGPGAARGAAAADWGVQEVQEVAVILKVHNSRDSGRNPQLQAMDEAMLRLQAAGMLTNTPFRPTGGSGGGGGGGEDVGRVPYTVGRHPEDPGGAESEAPVCCWACLPCTCHPPPPPPPPEHEGPTTIAPGGAGLAEADRDERPQLHWYIVRCLSYVPGRMLSSVPYLTPGLMGSLGRMMGGVTAALAGWRPPALLAPPDAPPDWHPESGAGLLRRLVPGIAAFDEEKKSLLLAVATELEAAAPLLSDTGEKDYQKIELTVGKPSTNQDTIPTPKPLPRQVCHADANDDNCVVSEDGQRVVGLIDFGDMAVMPRVCEVAITTLYALLLALNRPMGQPPAPASALGASREPAHPSGAPAGDDAAAVGSREGLTAEEDDQSTLERLLAVAGLILAGYQSVVPLTPAELAVLPLLLRGRLAQSLALGAASVVADPGNADYLLKTERTGWRVMRLLTPGSVLSDEQLRRRLVAAADAAADAAAAPGGQPAEPPGVV